LVEREEEEEEDSAPPPRYRLLLLPEPYKHNFLFASMVHTQLARLSVVHNFKTAHLTYTVAQNPVIKKITPEDHPEMVARKKKTMEAYHKSREEAEVS
jgi:hypothetical protein